LAKDFADAHLRFLGAARTVTGSKYLVRSGEEQLLVDCGLFQGLKDLRLRNWEPLPVEPAAIAHVVLTHAHIDHTGYLPRLASSGFRGSVWATPATRDLCDVLLRDSAKLQEEEAAFANKRGYSKHRPALPLYTVEDAERILRNFKILEYGRAVEISPAFSIRFEPAGHILGSAIVRVEVRYGGESKTIVFSGDLGRYGSTLLNDPTAQPGGGDDVIVESTYGNRVHQDVDPQPHFKALLERVVQSKGILLVPAFAVGRTQELLYLLKVGMASGLYPKLPVHLDSPMAIDATEIYCKYTDEQRIPHEHGKDGGCAYIFGELQIARTVEESKKVGALPGPRIIIAASGMATGGRILHHLKARLPDPTTNVLFVGYQAPGTRGRSLVEGAKQVKIHGEEIEVRATIDVIDALSAHADKVELARWMDTFDAHPPRRVFVTHGEPEAAEEVAAAIRTRHGWDARVPNHLERVGIF
jgi:metallo-beta-lactamase family protein